MVDLSGVFGATLSFAYDDATLSQAATATDDGTGSISRGAPTSHPCKVQVEAATLAMRGSDDFADTDVRLLVLTATCAVNPVIGDELAITSGKHAGERYRIQSRDIDPGAGAWDMRGRLLR
jgi:Fe2+ transport system protein FeoA